MNDPDLQSMFDDAAKATAADESFVQTTISNIRRARRQRLAYKLIAATPVATGGAAIAPYVARATLATSSYLTTEAGAVLACACATLLTWRIARRALS